MSQGISGITEINKHKIIVDYKAGVSIKNLQAKYGAYHRTIRKFLCSQGIEIRWNREVGRFGNNFKKGYKATVEQRKRWSKLAKKKNKKCHFWRGGSSSRISKIRGSLKYRLWKEAVWKRDGGLCRNCGMEGQHAHHIKPIKEFPKLIYTVKNGLLLCRKCHTEIHRQKENS